MSFLPTPPLNEVEINDTTNKKSTFPPNPFLGNQVTFKLTKKDEKLCFKTLKVYDILFHWKQSFDDRIRFIDSIRMYKPNLEECSLLNIPDERLNLQSIHPILLLSGGAKGVRFTTEDFSFIQSIVNQLVSSFNHLESEYKKFSSKMKRLKHNISVFPDSDFYKNMVQSSDDNINSILLDIEKLEPSVIDQNFPYIMDRSATQQTSLNNSFTDKIAIVKFHLLADWYLYRFLKLHTFIQDKQKSIQADTAFQINKDPEASIGKKYPIWLEVFIRKCYQIHQNNSTDKFVDSETKINFNDLDDSLISNLNYSRNITVGKLACFITCCVLKKIELNNEETVALEEIIEASRDNSELTELTTPSPSLSVLKAPIKCPEEYWSQRLFNFMKSLTELKSWPKDEKSLHHFEQYMK